MWERDSPFSHRQPPPRRQASGFGGGGGGVGGTATLAVAAGGRKRRRLDMEAITARVEAGRRAVAEARLQVGGAGCACGGREV